MNQLIKPAKMKPELIEKYITDHSTAEDELLTRLNHETHRKALMPRMLSGHLQGKILELFSKMISPNKIMELGTYTGYSAICMAKGLKKDGQLHTIELNDELEHISSKYFSESGFENQIIQHTGDASTIAASLGNDFDLIFIDADKRQYPDYYKICMKALKKGGYIIADNVLWGDKVVEPLDEKDEYTKGILEFNTLVQNDPNCENVMFPVRDGLMIVRKIS